MSFLHFFAKKRPASRGFQTKKTASKFQKTFILEPILTPSGIVDGGDDAPDLAMLEPPAELMEDVDFLEMEDDLVGDAPDWKVSEGEEISFFTPEAETEVRGEISTELTGDESVEDASEELPLFDGNDYIPTFESGVFAVGDSGEVSLDFLFDGGRWEGEVAIFSLEGMDEFEPGSEGFIQEAASRALSDSELGHVVISDAAEGARFSGSLGEFYGGQEADWNEGDYRGVKTFSMRPGDEFGIMLVPKGTVEAVFDNPGIEGYQRPLFSMVTANPDDAFHVGQIADVTGDGSTFVMEDWRVDDGSDRDYNDIIFQVKGATGQAPLMDSLIEPENDWRDMPVGQAIIDYVLPEPAQVEFDFPEENQPLIGVIDTGFSGDNPDLDYDRIILGRDRVEGDDNPLLPSTPNDESVTKEPTTPQNDEHGTHVLGTIGATQDNGIGIDGVNDDAPLWVGRAIGSGQWADSLAEFVDAFRESEQPNAVVNLSLDLTQINPDGSETTRYEFTPQERAAIEYARQHDVLIVVAAGNDGGVMSILGQASQEFDNIITVGSSDGLDRADYSSYGYGLDILAPGGTTEYPVLSTTGDGVGTMAGTSVATSRVTGAASQVWAANPQLHYRQVIEVLKATATDLKTPGWDTETGAGLLNLAAAVSLAKVTKPEDYAIPAIDIPETWSGEGVLKPVERAASFNINQIIAAAPSYLEPYAQESIPQILAESQASGITDIGQIAYILATAQHESHLGRWMEEIASGEAYEGRLDLGNTQPGDGQRFKGRGYVQITGRSNYTKWSQRLGIDLVGQPHKASEPAIAAKILVQGMRDGTFTTKKLSDYINGLNRDFWNARRIVNGIDKAAEIAQIAENYFKVLGNANATMPQPQPSTTGRRPYIVRSGDTLWAIAQRELGNGNRWREIQKEDGNTFTEAEARLLKVGEKVYLPVKYQTGSGRPVTPSPVTVPTPIDSRIGRGSRAPHLFQQAYIRIKGRDRGLIPTGDAYRWGNGWTQEFRDARGDRFLLMLEDGANTAFLMQYGNLAEYEFMGGPVGRELDGRQVYLGYPRSDENPLQRSDGKWAVWQAFAANDGKARIHYLDGIGSIATWGVIGSLYTNLGGATHWLGMPTRREYFDGDTIFADFQGGRIAYLNGDGRIEVLRLNEQPSWRQTTQTGRVNSRVGNVRLRFRSQPNTNAQIIGQLSAGTTFKIVRQVEGSAYYPDNRTDWYEIEVNGQRGYVASYYVDIVDNSGGSDSNEPPLHSNPTESNPLRGFSHPLMGIGSVTQPPGGSTSHSGRMRYAIDYGVPIGTPVYAMRSGRVVRILQGFPDTGGGEANLNRANLVVVEHDGGYRSAYLHLKQGFADSIQLNEGDSVQKGQLIGYSGNSGWSTGPHLHVEVHKPNGIYFGQTVPFVIG